MSETFSHKERMKAGRILEELEKKQKESGKGKIYVNWYGWDGVYNPNAPKYLENGIEYPFLEFLQPDKKFGLKPVEPGYCNPLFIRKITTEEER